MKWNIHEYPQIANLKAPCISQHIPDERAMFSLALARHVGTVSPSKMQGLEFALKAVRKWSTRQDSKIMFY
jgi:hypothetical protein